MWKTKASFQVLRRGIAKEEFEAWLKCSYGFQLIAGYIHEMLLRASGLIQLGARGY